MVCPECKNENPAENRFCGMCGAPLVRAETVTETAEPEPDRSALPDLRPEFTASEEAVRAVNADSVEPVPEPVWENISGPSFLGLSGDRDTAGYLLEEEPRPSHTRRNLVLVALALLAILGVLEWRSNRSGGTNVSMMEVLHLRLPKKHHGAQPGSGAATQTPGATEQANGSATPQFVAEPVKPAIQPTPSPTTQAAVSPQPSPASTPVAQAQVSPAQTASSSEPAPAPAAKPREDNAANPKPTEAANNVPPAASKSNRMPQSETVEPAAKPKSSGRDLAPEDDARAGAAELQRGVAAGATDLGRMWLWKSTAKGNSIAPVLLAQMYLDGNGVAKNCDQAVLLLQTASRKNNPRARSKLADLYSAGQCVPRDRVQAYRWMSSALDANPGSEWLAQNRDTLWHQMTAGERQRARAFR